MPTTTAALYRLDLVAGTSEVPWREKYPSGGAGRLSFSVIGDAVNLAARVAAATRQTDDVLITEATKRLLLRRLAVVSRDTVPLKGKAEPLEVFSPLTLVEEGLADPVRR